ncbi:Bax inhibitor-1 family protein [Anabaenopsis tanganyikae CS-531]|uniref:Bax inhibitor-1 family protein n=2 Tax=Anabaenopsis TaxID=110103 RepID=A0ABT5AN84_9CYAN|nr:MULTISPECIES: Bax inhibitor-1 family protein [Anabaenopsis]MDB9538770.1 Bax inhibitor-1 family protein [Anabaenopsis arnoldii]MDH6091047.1 Bax inhibitor-1 family protein [Anabaenopsis arnoldii]MDH6106243.1 Bax inhibitor-1 family protein [Anabaenopsis tanganyikae CS-531]
MSNTSNFRDAIREARTQSLIGPNVIANALPYVGGGLVLTALGTYGGLGVIRTNPAIFFPTFIGAVIVELILFFVARNVAEKGNKSVALPLLATYGLLSGYTLSGLVFLALQTQGVGIQGVGLAALGCGVTFIVARQIGSNLSENDGMALTKTIRLGVIALVVVVLTQFVLAMFGVYTPSWLEIGISGLGVFLFVGVSVVDFYILPRTYRDNEYLPAALSMYLTYINLFVFILRLLIALNSRD